MRRLLLLMRFDAVSDDVRIHGDKFPGKGNERQIARLADVIEEGIDWLGNDTELMMPWVGSSASNCDQRLDIRIPSSSSLEEKNIARYLCKREEGRRETLASTLLVDERVNLDLKYLWRVLDFVSRYLVQIHWMDPVEVRGRGAKGVGSDLPEA